MTLQERSAKRATLKSPVRENRTPGFVRGHPGDRVPYLDRQAQNARMLKNASDNRWPAVLALAAG
jgi:hypothetical protein